MSLLHSGKYERALKACEKLLAANPHDELALACLPHVYLCLGRLEEALEGFIQSNARAKLRPFAHIHPYLGEISAIQWLLGMREEAVRTARFSVDGILDGTIEYADATGGTPQGLLLWYMGVSMHDNETRDHALAYLRTVTSRRRIDDSPGLAEFAIGELSKDQLLRSVFSTKILWLVRLQAKLENYKRVWLSEIWFYFGVQARAEGNEAECQQCMHECSQLRFGVPGVEWYLAKAEVASQRVSE